MNHASWLDVWDRGLVVPVSRSYAVEGKEPKSTPSFFFFFEKKQYKQYKEIRLSDETKQPPTVPTHP